MPQGAAGRLDQKRGAVTGIKKRTETYQVWSCRNVRAAEFPICPRAIWHKSASPLSNPVHYLQPINALGEYPGEQAKSGARKKCRIGTRERGAIERVPLDLSTATRGAMRAASCERLFHARVIRCKHRASGGTARDGETTTSSGSYGYRIWAVLLSLPLAYLAIAILASSFIGKRRAIKLLSFLAFAALIFGMLWAAPRLDHARPGFYWRVPESTTYDR